MTDWKVVSASGDVMEVLLTFDDPLWVSQNALPCFVTLDFGDGQSFRSAGFDKSLAKDTVKRVQLDKLLPKGRVNDALRVFTTVITGITVALALATPFLSVALNNVKHMIEGLQVVLYYPMMYVMAPSNLGVLQKVVMLIVTFEVIPGEVYQNYIWYWKVEEKVSARLEAVGIESNIFMISMGLPFYVFGLACVLLLIALFM